jgi:predicted ATPase
MISKVAIRNFKSLRDVHVGLERFTVFVGPNASGKSSILQSLDLLCRTFRTAGGMLQQYGAAAAQVLGTALVPAVDNELAPARSWASKDPVELAAEVGGTWYRYRTRVSPAPPPPFAVSRASWDGAGPGTAPADGSDAWEPWRPEQGSTSPMPPSVLLRLEASKLVQPVPGQADPTIMAPDGTGLHSALAGMTLNDPDSWQALQTNLNRIIPTIRRLRHTKAAQMNQPTSVLFDTVGADSLPATQVSEGTLLVLGLLAALHAPGRPNLVLLDDLDRGLHPKAQKELIALLRGLLETSPDLQIVATTHSPYMLDCMGVDEVRMTFLKDDGATVCAALTSHPKFPKWKDEMTPGEMWSLFGEKWVAEEVAA